MIIITIPESPLETFVESDIIEFILKAAEFSRFRSKENVLIHSNRPSSLFAQPLINTGDLIW